MRFSSHGPVPTAMKIGMGRPATTDKTTEIASTLKQLLTVTRDGWKGMTELEAI